MTTNREQRAREVLAEAVSGFLALQTVILSGSNGSAEDAYVGIGPAIRAMLAFSDAERSAQSEPGDAPTPPQQSAPAIPDGMKPWHGGDSAPEDWDGGPVLFRCGETGEAECDSWSVGTKIGNWRPNEYDIIAYTPKQQSAPASDVLREAAIHAVADIEMQREGAPYSRSQEEFYNDAAETVDAVLAALTTSAPQRDELVERARRLYRGLEMSAGIMRDRRRTGGWEGADRTANAFERFSEEAKSLHQALSQPSPSQGEEGEG